MIQCLYFGIMSSSEISVHHLNHRCYYFGHATSTCTATWGRSSPPLDRYRTPLLELVIRQSESELHTSFLSLFTLTCCSTATTRANNHRHTTLPSLIPSVCVAYNLQCVVCRSLPIHLLHRLCGRTRTFPSRTMRETMPCSMADITKLWTFKVCVMTSIACCARRLLCQTRDNSP